MPTRYFLSKDCAAKPRVNNELVEFSPFWRCNSTHTDWGIALTESDEVADILKGAPFVEEISEEDFTIYENQRRSYRNYSNILPIKAAHSALLSTTGDFARLGNEKNVTPVVDEPAPVARVSSKAVLTAKAAK